MTTLLTAVLTSTLTMLTLGALALPGATFDSSGPAQTAGFEPPPNQDAPNSTAGGGSRPTTPACHWENGEDETTTNALALAPQAFVGQSKAAQPTLWLYIPKTETTSGISTIEISLFDQQLNGIAQAQQPLTNHAGLTSLQLSGDFTLSPGQAYYWSAAFICNPARRTEDWVVGGWVQYEPLSEQEQQALKDLSSLALANRYITTGYWYDALETLLPLLQGASPSVEIKAAWAALLQQANINAEQIDLEEDVPVVNTTDS
ncbi:MAG: DUF928 domain-containing protein [Cyanobacteria bacterium J06598_3]